MTPLRNIPLASSVSAPPADGTIRPFDCSIRFEQVMERFWAAQGRPSGPKPIPKPIGPGASHKVKKFVAGGRQPKTPRPYAFPNPKRVKT